MSAGPRTPVIDFGNMVAGVLGWQANPEGEGAQPVQGIQPDRLRGDLAERFRAAFTDVEERRVTGEMGFFSLPGDRALAGAAREAADTFGQWFETVVVIGIGGSALGTAALRDALLAPGWNELDDEGRDHFPRLHILDNPDPDTVSALLARVDLARTLFNIVSKSGTTAETMAQFLVVWGALEAALGADKVRGHLLVTTSPGRGTLRELADEYDLPSLPLPESVGGRFSVLSPAGLFPAAVTGVDVDALLAGAAEMAERCRGPELMENPAGLVATLLHVADTESRASVQVFMPYADRLRGFAYWVQQLWAESLGKALDRDGRRVETGPTPLPSFGASDQHSILQLLMEGPRDKVVVFLGRDAPGKEVTIPLLLGEKAPLGYLGGRTLFELLDRERRATAEALRREGRMNMTIMVDRVDARALGALFMLFQIAVVYAGALYNVDPLDQPGVELGKVLTCGLMGRSGYDPPEIPDPDPRWRV
ncbi:MAG: glucose-6-phosphate isomerase [Gemmatimonadetes bacterium]|nr:glucose-6-phosphate isomerase [Gemmatimonadota bacterium]